MNDVAIQLDSSGHGSFFIEEAGEHLAEMVISIAGGNLTVFHTEVSEKLRGHGVADKLLSAMVDYARKQQLKVIPLCPFVAAQFKRNPALYQDIWNQHWHPKD